MCFKNSNRILINAMCACIKQKMTLRTVQELDVSLSCNKNSPQGELKVLNGIAHNEDLTSNAKYTIDFNLAIKPSVWVVGLDTQYRYMVLSDRSGSTLHIFSRTPTLHPALYREALRIADDQNLSVNSLELTNHNGCLYP